MKRLIPSFLSSSPNLTEQETNAASATGSWARGAAARTAAVPIPPLPAGLASHVICTAQSIHTVESAAIELRLAGVDQLRDLSMQALTRQLPLLDVAVEAGLLNAEQVGRITEMLKIHVSVDRVKMASPEFLTWKKDVEKQGGNVEILEMGAAQIQEEKTRAVAGVDIAAEMNNLRLARQMFMDAAHTGASDLQLLVKENHAEVQIRIQGDYWNAKNFEMPRADGEALMRSIITGLATVKPGSYNPHEFQDAQINGPIALPGSHLSSVRLKRGPMYPAEQGAAFLAARLQYIPDEKGQAVPGARAITLATPKSPPGEFLIKGYSTLQMELMLRLLYQPMGIVVITGPTSSGKTTTLFEAMRHQARLFPHRRLITIENPPEYPQPWAITLASNESNSLEMVRHTLRMDPDIIMLSEVRSGEEGVAAMQEAMTGHFTWITLHVTDAFRVPVRLEQMDPKNLSLDQTCDHEIMRGWIAQRIAPVLCPDCSVPFSDVLDTTPAYWTRAIKSWGNNRPFDGIRARGKGCATCGGRQILRSEALAEIVVTTPQLMEDYRAKGIHYARKQHRMTDGADQSLLAHAMDRIYAGTLDPTDVQTNIHDLIAYEEGL
ncbi:ATPase, T2SS/T4P/T4SS family [Paraburkholderia youngii]|uniref:ATPase, T2SS/T4P/T4SS family n=1 Tax=Paraburkholderia youngii TaxID=2782701 RepID=UPI003D2505EF